MPSKSEDEKVGHIIMNNTIKLTSLYFLAESGSGDQVDNGRFQNQNLQESTGGRQFRCRKASSPIWAPLKRKKAPRGNPKAAIAARWRASKTTRKFRRSQAAIVEGATKELEALAAHTPLPLSAMKSMTSTL